MFPILIHYFAESDGLKVKPFELQTMPNEMPDTITAFCIDALSNYNIPVKGLVALRTYNTNTKFGGRERHRMNNAFYKLK